MKAAVVVLFGGRDEGVVESEEAIEAGGEAGDDIGGIARAAIGLAGGGRGR